MLPLKDLGDIRSSLFFTSHDKPPILYPINISTQINLIGINTTNDDDLYEFMKEHYKTIANDFFDTPNTFYNYYLDWNAETNYDIKNLLSRYNLSNTLKTYTNLIASFLILSWHIYKRVNKPTIMQIENLFEKLQNKCNQKEMYEIKLQLETIISNDNILTRYKSLILYQDPVLETYPPSKTNRSKLKPRTIKALKKLPRYYIDLCAKKHSEITIEKHSKYDIKKQSFVHYKETTNFTTKSLRYITHKFRNKEHNKYFGVIKLPDILKVDLTDLYIANEVMKIYWDDERSLSYGNQVSKVSGRIYRLIQTYKSKDQDQLKYIEKDLLKLTKLEITKIVRESFELSIYPD